MEEELLKDMIHERDKKISELKAKVERQCMKLDKWRKDLDDVRALSSENRLEHRKVIAELLKKRDDSYHRMQQTEREVRNQNGSLHIYAEILREAAPDNVDSSYVLRMQSQLCKAMHSMGIIEHQMILVREYSNDLIKSLKDSINGVVEDKSAMELRLMNELMAIDNAKRDIEDEYTAKIEDEGEEIEYLQKSIADLDEKSEGEDQDSDENDEAREQLQQLNDDIEYMTAENQKQLEIIKDIKQKLSELKSTGEERHQDVDETEN